MGLSVTKRKSNTSDLLCPCSSSYCCRLHYPPQRVGNSYLLMGDRPDRYFPFTMMVGPDWTCMILTYLLITVPTILFIVNVASKWGVGCIIAVAFLWFSTVGCYTLTACSDPGIVFRPEEEDDEDEECLETGAEERTEEGRVTDPQADLTEKKSQPAAGRIVQKRAVGGRQGGSGVGYVNRDMLECGVCGIRRPPNASHCYECGVCVVELDHHCPWTGKCIGKKTLQSFYAFLIFLGLLLCFVVVFVIVTALEGREVFHPS